MAPAFTLRPMTQDDSDALASLYEGAPDTGSVRIRVRHQVPVAAAILSSRPGTVGVVAEASNGELVGAAALTSLAVPARGALGPAAYLHSLAVAPEYRRRGIAGQLGRWRIDREREQHGDDVPLLALIQRRNEASFAVARQWATQFLGPYRIGAIPIRPKPRPLSGWQVGAAGPEDLPAVATSLNEFHRGHELWTPATPESLAAWTAVTPIESPIRHIWLAHDSAGTLLAGAQLTETYRVLVREVVSLPPLFRLVNRVAAILPPDRTVRLLDVGPFWYAPGRIDAVKVLLQAAGAAWVGRATHLGFGHDPRGPAGPVLPGGPLSASSSLWLATGGGARIDEHRPLAPVVV